MTGLFASSPLRYIPHRRVLSEASITKSERRQPSEFAAFRPYFGVNDIGLWNKVNLTLTSIHFENVQCLFGLQLTLDMLNPSTLWVENLSELPPTSVILKKAWHPHSIFKFQTYHFSIPSSIPMVQTYVSSCNISSLLARLWSYSVMPSWAYYSEWGLTPRGMIWFAE